ncbi:DUF3418 domain-containing protein [Nakamurella flavida]|uniref:DUF3418 domain-containing protein n=1 Tax=Nakamurella flavida TaxID=363630 RepID=A0A939C070_9ACTN|nr:DUF3418 domain-containing protein [Nakamurella flavida]MBM9476413.1 DUF3418 domain-containing protein [Nakamurella flavida]MDP9779486.1 ATP-dependent helicase HrpA [Nakamurella flavida]
MATVTAPPDLTGLSIADERRLGRRWQRLSGLRDPARRDREQNQLLGQTEAARNKMVRRRAAVPALNFPPELPVSERVDDLAAAIAEHQVVIVAGETGSGKSTQLPKVCLQLGRGVRGTIGHTQPRRIAARALAERIAEETGTELGGAIGYTVRFGDHTGPDTLVKLMTDGILLAEIGRDPDLLAYDTIILDEAHERSLTIDFLLGYLVRLLPRRPDLKVIITSATIDPERFSRHFGDAPIIEVSGRTYPVEIRYRPWGLDAEDAGDGDDPDDLADDLAEVPGDPDRPAPVRTRARSAARPAGQDRAAQPDQAQAICAAVDELEAQRDGDILVFLSGEREITDTAEVLRGHLAGRPGRYEVLPLYGRLSAAEQHKVFSAHTGRRIVLSTNVAETSLTVPGIRFVIDPGTARISRYSSRTKVQRLPIEPISQASAGQRAGRCGRVADGICIRLYSEEDFLGRPEFTDPEIARTSLASVILQMASLDLGDIADFPFLDPPDRRQITDGITVLTELGALETGGDRVLLTPTGRSLAALPVDPRLARMIVEGDRRGCLAELLVIVSALSIVDVREYPLEDREKATASHSRFVEPHSDFLSLVNLWRYLGEQGNTLSGNAFRRMCKQEYLHYLRIREWQDLHSQLRQIARGLGMDVEASARIVDVPAPAAAEGEEAGAPEQAPVSATGVSRGRRRHGRRGQQLPTTVKPAAGTAATQAGKGSLATGMDVARIHTALLAGLLSHIGLRLEPGREYQGTRGTKFVIWPGSALAKSGPRLVVAGELVETSRLWGRLAARIEPEWVETVGGELLRRNYSEPHWSARRGAVVASEKVTLLGVTLVAARSVAFDRIDPELCRELFIRHALVEGDWQTRHAFFAANQAALAQVQDWEDRVRRRDLVDDEALFAFYTARIPADVTSARHFDSWWKKVSREDPGLLTVTAEQLVAAGADAVDPAEFPDRFTSGGVDLDLDYTFDPTSEQDGVGVTIPLAVLARVDAGTFDQQVPGLRQELAVALLRTLPKTLRRSFVPAPDFARAALAHAGGAAGASGSAGMAAELARALTALTSITVRASDFDVEKVPAHLRMTFTVVDERGRAVGTGKDLAGLQQQLAVDSRQAVAKASGTVERSGLTAFPADGVRQSVTSTVDGHRITGYPALVDDGDSVSLRMFTSRDEQLAAMRGGVRRLLVLRSRSPLAHLRYALTRTQLMTLATSPHGSMGALVQDAVEAAVDALLDWSGGLAWTVADFEVRATRIAGQLDRAVTDVLAAGEQILRAANDAQEAIAAVKGTALTEQVADLRAELARLVHPRFLAETGAAGLPDRLRHVQALARRATRLPENPGRDRERMVEIAELRSEIDAAADRLGPRGRPGVAAVRQLLEEYRVAAFAQPMRTAVPVSAKRIRSALTDLLAD